MGNKACAFSREMIRAYFNYLATDRAQHEEGFEAWLQLDELIRSNPDEAWKTLVELINSAPSKDLLGNVGAGQLEDFLSYHIVQYIDRLKDEAALNKRLVAALYIARIGRTHPGYDLLEALKTDHSLAERDPFDALSHSDFAGQ